jgi:pantoate--beta-alanine ligase
MQIIRTQAQLQSIIKQWQAENLRIGFVATMGNLHAGHLRLVQEAKRRTDRIVVSIFVNQLQFNNVQDFQNYPRTLEADIKLLTQEETHCLFAPEFNEMYPLGLAQQTKVVVPDITDLHCGASRPGHFIGVATIVNKLFQLIKPDISFWGEKDYQQVLVIKKMVTDLNMGIEVFSIPTVRAEDGLALSSRNVNLTAIERQIAPKLYQILGETKTALLKRANTFDRITTEAIKQLQQAGFQVDYFNTCDANTLQPADHHTQSMVILAAAFLGKVRLIDNIVVS